MKKLTKILSIIAIIALLVVSLSTFISCDKVEETINQVQEQLQEGQPVEEATTFELVVRKYNGSENYVAKLDGEILAQKTIDVAAGQVNVYEALTVAATNEGSTYKISFNDTDYIVFTLTQLDEWTKSWKLTSGHFNAVPEYTDLDFAWSYMAFNGHYSNGVYMDFVDGLKTYTIVIDGYDGNIGSQL